MAGPTFAEVDECMKTLFIPGCALREYKPELIARLTRFLMERGIADEVCTECCKSDAPIEEGAAIIDCCPGCSSQFERRYPGSSIRALWQVLLETDFPFPDYHGQKMSIQDSCRARNRYSQEMQESARALCRKMNIELCEPKYTRDQVRCCGGSAPDLETRRKMALRRAEDFPEKDVVVYCTGCARSLSMTAAAPRHLLDLLFEEPTEGLYPKI